MQRNRWRRVKLLDPLVGIMVLCIVGAVVTHYFGHSWVGRHGLLFLYLGEALVWAAALVALAFGAAHEGRSASLARYLNGLAHSPTDCIQAVTMGHPGGPVAG